MKGADTLFIERLQIVKGGDALHYIADVDSNPAPVKFRINTWSDSSFSCENPEHDFPKTISYKREGASMVVELSDGERIVKVFFIRENE